MANEPVKYEPNAPVNTQGTLRSILDSDALKHALAEVAPKHLTPERVVKMVLLAASRQPKLLECSQESLLKAAMSSSELGLDCSGTLGRAYLVPYKNNKTGRMEAQFQVGYLGLLDLARRSGEIESVTAEVVYVQDLFDYQKGLDEKLVHKPNYEATRQDKDIVGAYAIIRLRPSGHHIEFMPRKEIEKIRNVSKAKDSGPWKDWMSEMCKKSVLRRALKFCASSVEIQQAIAKTDDEFELSAVEMRRELKETDGREKWDRHQPEPEPPIETVETPEPEVTDEQRKDLEDTARKHLATRGVTTKARQNAAISDMCTAVGAKSLAEITTIDQLNGAIDWMAEMFGGEGD